MGAPPFLSLRHDQPAGGSPGEEAPVGEPGAAGLRWRENCSGRSIILCWGSLDWAVWAEGRLPPDTTREREAQRGRLRRGGAGRLSLKTLLTHWRCRQEERRRRGCGGSPILPVGWRPRGGKGRGAGSCWLVGRGSRRGALSESCSRGGSPLGGYYTPSHAKGNLRGTCSTHLGQPKGRHKVSTGTPGDLGALPLRVC